MRRDWWAVRKPDGTFRKGIIDAPKLYGSELEARLFAWTGDSIVRVRISVVPDKPKRKGKKPCKT